MREGEGVSSTEVYVVNARGVGHNTRADIFWAPTPQARLLAPYIFKNQEHLSVQVYIDVVSKWRAVESALVHKY